MTPDDIMPSTSRTYRKNAHLQGCGIAAATGVAMEEILHPAYSADAAGRAVELLLGGVVLKEAALEAGIRPKLHAAADAGLPHGLLEIA